MKMLMVLLVGLLGMCVHAQTIRIKVVNGKSGHPIAGACVNIGMGTKGNAAAMAIPTDKDGVASFRLTDDNATINTQTKWTACGYFGVVNPVVKYADSIRINIGYVSCQPHAPHYSWLLMMTFSTENLLRSGVVTANACGKATASPDPGEIVLFVRPLTFWEKLKQ